ncbi:helix-turn-helix domain-containing protein [Metabacillus idriensis]|uniref:helix-turn-helix domain-containing protein n=1 Tax=Metabacillus idriensis TaxID=324768 RepID=UPI001748D555|nr:helix-turn-helix transcriptional regulator [Metabacillus idriensis]
MLNKPCKEFGEFIYFNRERSYISEENFALMLHTSISFVKRLERGEVHPTDTLITEISKILTIPCDDMKGKIWCDPPTDPCPAE